mgnify:FL=1|jgi:hypothetical protein
MVGVVVVDHVTSSRDLLLDRASPPSYLDQGQPFDARAINYTEFLEVSLHFKSSKSSILN